MPSGGARIRSGPAADPRSKRSDRRGLTDGWRDLDAEGWSGKAPEWPLPTGKGAGRNTVREKAQWRKLWKCPQAEAWIEMPWLWQQIALYVRLSVRCEDPQSQPALITQMLRLADIIGLTPSGLQLNQWKIIKTTPELEAVTDATDAFRARRDQRRRRMRGTTQDDEAGG